MSHGTGTDSEVGSLRTVLVHRPGPELRRVTPRTLSRLQFDAVPWVARAQREHDALTDVLRDHGAEVLYLTELLQDVLEYSVARQRAITSVLDAGDLGEDLAGRLGQHLDSLPPEDLAATLIAGLTGDELRSGRGLVYELLDPRDFVIEPLPSLVFSRDSSIWIGDQPVVAGLAGARRRETDLLALVYAHHPRFGGLGQNFTALNGSLHGGDVLLLGPGVVAVGVGVRTTPAAAEQLARHLLSEGLAHTVLAVPLSQRGQGSYLDRLCTVVGEGTVIMFPALAFTLTALSITVGQGELRVSRPRPFLEAAARAIGVDALRVIDTGTEPRAPHPGAPGQWDDGTNALALGPRLTLCNERNADTNARLAAAGFEVIEVPGTELGGLRGGPRCMCAPIDRDPAGRPDHALEASESGRPGIPAGPAPVLLGGPAASEPADPESGHARRAEELAPTS